MQNKVVVPGKVKKESNKKYKIEKDKSSESDVTVELTGDGDYQVEKLSVDGLPTNMIDGNPIRWFNNFAIKKNGQYINEIFFVTIPDPGKSRVVIFDGNGNPYYYTGEVIKNTIELTDGDPAGGFSP
ncbi:MAG: hypothetical protein H7Y59_15220 [Anaerolineales bacterium]|nr:hypothetical protein [Anaerolineales bacterium]